MYLTHKDYSQPEKSERVVPDIKEEITSYVGKGSKSYEEIIMHILESENMTNDEIIRQIEEVKKTVDYSPVIEEEIK